MAILHSFVVIGVMTGYIVGAITITLFEKFIGWRFAFMLQGWFMIAIGIGFLGTSNQHLDIFGLMKGTSGGQVTSNLVIHTVSNDGGGNTNRGKSLSEIGGLQGPSNLIPVKLTGSQDGKTPQQLIVVDRQINGL